MFFPCRNNVSLNLRIASFPTVESTCVSNILSTVFCQAIYFFFFKKLTCRIIVYISKTCSLLQRAHPAIISPKRPCKRCCRTEGHLSAALTQCAWAASRTKNTYLRAKYHSLVGRRGKKRALIAVGHKILVMAYHIIKNGVPYKEIGKDYLLHRRADKIVKNHIKRLRDLGYEVELKKAA
jgi:hypothetical protein